MNTADIAGVVAAEQGIDKAAAKRQAREQAENNGQAPTAPSDDT